MTALSAPPVTPAAGSKVSLLGLGEQALRLLLVAALPVSAAIFVIQTL